MKTNQEFKTDNTTTTPSEGTADEALEQYVSGLSGVSSSGQPSLVFLYTAGEVDRKDPLYQQMNAVVKASKVVEQALLYTQNTYVAISTDRVVRQPTPRTKHDYRVALGAKKFNCVRVNLANLHPSENKYINCLTAPMIIITDDQGKVVKTHTGSSLRPSSVFGTMTRVMTQMGYRNFSSKITAANKYLNTIYKAEVHLKKAEKRNNAAGQAMAEELKEGIARYEQKYKEALAEIEQN